MKLPKPIVRLTESFERLPGIGPKSAQRLVFYLLHTPESFLNEFASRLQSLKRDTVLCKLCHNISDKDPCDVCSDDRRDRTLLCVAEQPLDVLALERSGMYHGMYHVLHGAIAPLNNIGPDQLYLHDILGRLDGVQELILATNPTMEGEATALYLLELIKQEKPEVLLGETNEKKPLSITRIGHGLPIGADIEYADSQTLARALDGRRSLQ